MSNCQKNTSTCDKRYGDSTCGKNISCNCAGFHYDGSAGNPNLNYYSVSSLVICNIVNQIIRIVTIQKK